MRVTIRKSDNRIIEAQSGDDAGLDVLVANAVAAGLRPDDVDARVMPDAEYRARMTAQAAADRPRYTDTELIERQLGMSIERIKAVLVR